VAARSKAYVYGRSPAAVVGSNPTLLALERVKPVPPMRNVQHSPAVDWDAVWANLHGVRLDGSVASYWYVAIHDIAPTRQRLAAIRLVPDPRCTLYGELDTLEHRLIACRQGPVLWRWTRGVLAAILTVCHTVIPDAWAWCPDYVIWPPQHRMAVTWIVAHFAHYRLWKQHGKSLNDYRTYLKGARRHVCLCPKRKRAVGNYLDVF
jgi:hypothetical protein